MNKKAQSPGDAILIVIFLVLLAIGGVVAWYVTDVISTGLLTSAEINSTPEAVAALEAGRNVNNSWDWLILFTFIGGAIGMLVLGYFLDVHSIFMPLYIIAMIVGVAISYIMTYVWEQVIAGGDSTWNTIVANNFVITNHLISNLALYFTVIAAMSLVATYAKTRAE